MIHPKMLRYQSGRIRVRHQHGAGTLSLLRELSKDQGPIDRPAAAGPIQRSFRRSADIAICGGTTGGGKTWALLMESLRFRGRHLVRYAKPPVAALLTGQVARELASTLKRLRLVRSLHLLWPWRAGCCMAGSGRPITARKMSRGEADHRRQGNTRSLSWTASL